MKIYCCSCAVTVEAVLISGVEAYPRRPDLHDLPFWQCQTCHNFVGCHYKTKNRTKPLGNIPTAELKNARKKIHALIDPAWKSKRIKRSYIYQRLSEAIGRPYHTAEIKNIDEARLVYRAAKEVLS